MKEEIKDILNDLKDSAENPSYTEIDAFSDEAYEVPNYFTLDPTNGGSKALLNYIENLQSQLKEKEEVIEEAREETKQWIGYYEMKAKERYDKNTSVFVNSTCKKGYVMDVASKLTIIDLILSKGENK